MPGRGSFAIVESTLITQPEIRVSVRSEIRAGDRVNVFCITKTMAEALLLTNISLYLEYLKRKKLFITHGSLGLEDAEEWKVLRCEFAMGITSRT